MLKEKEKRKDRSKEQEAQRGNERGECRIKGGGLQKERKKLW